MLQNDIGAKMSRYPTFLPFFLSDTYYPTAFYFLSAYASHLEITGHTILSINRHYIIKNVRINQACWSKQVKWTFYVLLFIAPMPTTVYRLFTPAKYSFNNEIPIITYVNPAVSKVVLFFYYCNRIIFSDKFLYEY